MKLLRTYAVAILIVVALLLAMVGGWLMYDLDHVDRTSKSVALWQGSCSVGNVLNGDGMCGMPAACSLPVPRLRLPHSVVHRHAALGPVAPCAMPAIVAPAVTPAPTVSESLHTLPLAPLEPVAPPPVAAPVPAAPAPAVVASVGFIGTISGWFDSGPSEPWHRHGGGDGPHMTAAPEIDPRDAIGGLTLLAGIVCIIRGRR